MQIVPAILTDKKDVLEKMIRQCEKFCRLVQIDIMDGKFVPTMSISPFDLAEISTSINMEIHLMVENPLPLIKPFKDAGARRIIFHFESKDEPWEVIREIRAHNLDAGIAINPKTAVKDIEDFLLSIDQVLIMTVTPGYYGSPFLPEMMAKITELKRRKGKFLVSVDGGIKMENILIIKNSGVDSACVGSGIFRGNPEENYKKLLEKISRQGFTCPKMNPAPPKKN
ncbi:MAG: ribulose-phosphate 3-epimerase [bacterium]